MDENNPSAADTALQAAREDLDDIIRQAAQIDNPARAIADSAFVLGYNAAPGSSGHPDASFVLFDPAQKAVERLDLMLASEPSPEAIEIRNELAAALSEFLDSMRTLYRRRLGETFGEGFANAICDGRELSEEEEFDIGITLYDHAKGPFYGFIMFSEDPKVPCKCSLHLSAALAERQVTPEQVKARLRERFGKMSDALSAFGRFAAEQMRSELLRPSPRAHVVPDEGEATKATDEILTRMRRS